MRARSAVPRYAGTCSGGFGLRCAGSMSLAAWLCLATRDRFRGLGLWGGASFELGGTELRFLLRAVGGSGASPGGRLLARTDEPRTLSWRRCRHAPQRNSERLPDSSTRAARVPSLRPLQSSHVREGSFRALPALHRRSSAATAGAHRGAGIGRALRAAPRCRRGLAADADTDPLPRSGAAGAARPAESQHDLALRRSFRSEKPPVAPRALPGRTPPPGGLALRRSPFSRSASRSAARRPGANAQLLEPRIVNGLPTEAFPTTGALLRGTSPDTAVSWCSGTLVGCNTFLTAAHCVCAANGSQCQPPNAPNPGDYQFYLQHAGIFSVSSISVRSDYAFPVADLAVFEARDARQRRGADAASTRARRQPSGRAAASRASVAAAAGPRTTTDSSGKAR